MIKRILCLTAIVLVMLCLPIISLPPAQAQTGGGYDLTWNTFDAGGIVGSSGGSFGLNGTIGQSDASTALTGSGYSLVGGFWPGILPFDVYLPFARR
jgi:hypothetical protein